MTIDQVGSIQVTDANFMDLARTWKSLRNHRKQLHFMASRYPVIIDFCDLHFVLRSPEEVDTLTKTICAKLKAHWRS